MQYTVFDMETDGLDATKIYCISYTDFDRDGKILESGTLTDGFGSFFNRPCLVCHNLVRFDLPVVKRLLGVDYKGTAVDTLAVSWYMFPMGGFSHGLEAWGERLGFPKPPIEDWENLPLERYVERCEGDREINIRLFHEQLDYLKALYSHGGNLESLFSYLTFKMECLRDQEEEGIDLDMVTCLRAKADLEQEIGERTTLLEEVMPKVLERTAPKRMYKKNGMLSKLGEAWMDRLKELGLPEDTMSIYGNGNPGSPDQVKEWLFSLGWVPRTFKVSKNTGKRIPQISLPFGGGICPSIEDLYDDHPVLENLGGYYMLRHRLGLIKSFLDNVDNRGKIYSIAHGFTNTMRLRHAKPVANLPGVDKPWGKEIRGCFKVPDNNHIMCGSDVSGLEDNTKQHYIYLYDPKYVEEMRVPGFDPHIDIGLLSELMTQEEADLYKEVDSRLEIDREYLSKVSQEIVASFKKAKKKRSTAKVVNFSGVYGAGPAKMEETLKCGLAFAIALHTAYWKRNAAVKRVANDCRVVKVRGQKWLQNPLSGFWMFLKAEKDRFSTLNQSSGVYVFDTWLRILRKSLAPYGIKVRMQYHDELMLILPKGMEDIVSSVLREAMKKVNEHLKLNVEIGISTAFGNNYAECH